MKYPGGNGGQIGEKVLYEYYPQGALKDVMSEVPSNNYFYLQFISYDDAGRVLARSLGAASIGPVPVLETDYVYNAWDTQGGRLSSLKSGVGTQSPPINPTLQNFEYNYDANGNITWIKDYVIGSLQTPQTQSFGYDSLNRLTSASASNGQSGTNYSENYSYSSSTGNLASKTGLGSYGYNDTNHQHAVTHLSGTQKYWYRCNGKSSIWEKRPKKGSPGCAGGQSSQS